MANSNRKTDTATLHTLEEFIAEKYNDQLTYRNFSILEKIDGIEVVSQCLVDDYLQELDKISLKITLSNDEYRKYKYAPDILAYDVYGSTQLDFVIMFINDMIDPKEFDLKTIKLPYASLLNNVLNDIYNTNAGYIEQNRDDNNITSY